MDSMEIRRGQVRSVMYGGRRIECRVDKAVTPTSWWVTTAEVLTVNGKPVNQFIAQVVPTFVITGVAHTTEQVQG